MTDLRKSGTQEINYHEEAEQVPNLPKRLKIFLDLLKQYGYPDEAPRTLLEVIINTAGQLDLELEKSLLLVGERTHLRMILDDLPYERANKIPRMKLVNIINACGTLLEEMEKNGLTGLTGIRPDGALRKSHYGPSNQGGSRPRRKRHGI